MVKPKSKTEKARDTGMAMVLIALIVFLALGRREAVFVAMGLLLVNMVWPDFFRPVAWIWLGLSGILGGIMSRVILTIVFVLVAIPMGLVRRLMGRDPMKRRAWKKGPDSVFEERHQTYSLSDLEHPF